MSDVTLSVEASPAREDVALLEAGLTAHALPFTGTPGFQPLAVFARDPSGRIVAGAYGRTSWNWLHVGLVWVAAELRHTGLGRRVVRAIELRVVELRPPRRYYLLQDASGQRIAGNLPQMKPVEGDIVLPVSSLSPGRRSKAEDPADAYPVVALGRQLDNGEFLLVGENRYRAVKAREAILQALAWGIVVTVLLAAGGGVLVLHVLQGLRGGLLRLAGLGRAEPIERPIEIALLAGPVLALGLADEYTRIWWDVRPHPRYGTLEVRMPDQPTRLEATAALAELVHRLVRSSSRLAAGENENHSQAGNPADRGAYAENRWAALRFGRDARLIHPDGTRLATVPELLDELGERVGAEAVEPLHELDQAGGQLEVGRSEGLEALGRRLVELT